MTTFLEEFRKVWDDTFPPKETAMAETATETEAAPIVEKPKPNTASGTMTGYRVEVRYNYSEPKVINGILLSKNWREINFTEGKPGVPIGGRYEMPELMSCYCLGYAAAQALRWWFHADAVASEIMGGLCLESRIVAYQIKYSREYVRSNEHMVVGGDDSSNSRPPVTG